MRRFKLWIRNLGKSKMAVLIQNSLKYSAIVNSIHKVSKTLVGSFGLSKVSEKACINFIEEEKSPVRIDIVRMEEAINTEVFTLPSGLSREEKRQFILNAGKR